MTTPKVGTIKRGGMRLYIDPDTGERVPGVTSISGALPKEGLKYWAAKMAGERAVDNLGEVVGIAMRDRKAAVEFVKSAHTAHTRAASERGTAVHELIERRARGEKVRAHPDYRGYLAGFDAFVREFRPEWHYLEATVWSAEHGYAGSFDAIATLHPEGGEPEKVLIDFKTTRSGVHADVALQINGYAYAGEIVTPNAEGGLDREPMPELDGAAVLHVRPESWSLVPVKLDPDIFECFLALKAGPVRWQRELQSGALGAPVAGGPTGHAEEGAK